MINIKDLSEEELQDLKNQFLEKRIIQLKDILKPIEEYFWKFDFNSDTQAYELYLGVPKDWIHDMTMTGYLAQLFSESDNGKIIKLGTTSDDHIGDLDEMVVFAIDIIQRNHAILSKIREKELELKLMKEKMVEIQMGLSRDIEKLKTIRNGDVLEEEETEEIVEVQPESIEKKIEVLETVITAGSEYKPPVTMSKQEVEEFIELVSSNGKATTPKH